MTVMDTLQREILEVKMEQEMVSLAEKAFGKSLEDCTDAELYHVILNLVKGMMEATIPIDGKKKVYYISAEFLIGKLLSNNLINLGIYDKVDSILKAHGKDMARIEDAEPEPSLGNGGLGRLAACFMDSIATLGLPGEGIGLNYHFGLFRQKFVDGLQTAEKDAWIEPDSWLTRTGTTFDVYFGEKKVTSRLYDIDVIGYDSGVNKLRLFDLESVDEGLVKEGITFDKTAVDKNLTLFLYPDDSDEAGNLLRIYQQYFMVSNAAQLILKEMKEKHNDLRHLDEFAVIQINDTHPSMIIPELIRILVEDKAFTMDEAIRVVSKTCAYTNHTILAEALEKWPIDYLEEVVPHLLPIIFELDARVKAKYKGEDVAIIDKDRRVHMAHMDIHYGFSVNGVAALHTEILKNTELKQFYDIYPEKFNNKTNGITFRRWLIHCNRELSDYIESLIGSGFKKDAMELEKLLKYKNDKKVLKKLEEIKKNNKKELKRYLYETQNLHVNEDSIFDVQVKRLHEYKRQQMNALYAIYKYMDIKAGNKPKTPITMIFGAKAAPAYTIAKDIIHLILCLQQLIDSDPEVSPYFQVIMLENYNVSKAAKVIPAADISEQISLASKEASGTGNMKFMLNGAVTLGTEDGANVEIHDLVGDDNIYIFGKKPQDVIDLYEEKKKDPQAGYISKEFYDKDPQIAKLVDFIVSDEMLAIGDKVSLERLYKEILNKDWFMTLLDLKEFIKTKEQLYKDYEKRDEWNRKCLINIANAGFFSSDRTIEQYNEDIWHLR